MCGRPFRPHVQGSSEQPLRGRIVSHQLTLPEDADVQILLGDLLFPAVRQHFSGLIRQRALGDDQFVPGVGSLALRGQHLGQAAPRAEVVGS